MKNEQMRNGSAPPSQSTNVNLPAIAAYQRHELTLLRMEDLLNNGSGSQSALPSEYDVDSYFKDKIQGVFFYQQ